jgi:preprotein translocase subunit SecG
MKYRRTWLLLGLLLALALLIGACAEREHRKVRLHEEQQEGEVVEEAPGQMIVE